jgi:putative flippase GtrA
MSDERKNEVGKFALSGVLATTIDYVLLNICAVFFGFPAIVANSISATVSSVFSYNFNKDVVFHDRIHSRRRTLVLYVVVIAVGILVIQNGILHLLQGGIAADIAHWAHPALESIKLGWLSEKVVALNISKLAASLVAAWSWNYFMLRRYVFITKSAARKRDETSRSSQ